MVVLALIHLVLILKHAQPLLQAVRRLNHLLQLFLHGLTLLGHLLPVDLLDLASVLGVLEDAFATEEQLVLFAEEVALLAFVQGAMHVEC